MKKSTWWWSVLGSVAVAACGGAAAEGIGDAMRDAGELVENAGDAMVDAGMRVLADASVDAGGAMKDAGGALKDAGTAVVDAGGAQAQERPDDGLPRSHWILRDKNNVPVQALVWGANWSTAARATKSRFTNTHGDCVSLGNMGQREIGLQYSLATGKLDGCQAYTAATWREAAATSLVVFATAACDGSGYSIVGSDYTQQIGNTHYYVDGAPSHVATYYTWNGTACVAQSPAGGRDIWTFKPVPQDVVNLLPAAPYTLEIAY